MTKIELPWSVGDRVWYTEHFSYSYEVECLHCEHTGSVLLATGKTMVCGVCSGCKTHIKRRDLKIRPQSGLITGFELTYDKDGISRLWWHVSGHSTFLELDDMYRTFYEARKRAQADNKKYGWPKKDFDRWKDDPFTAHISYPDKMYWGRRVGKSIKNG